MFLITIFINVYSLSFRASHRRYVGEIGELANRLKVSARNHNYFQEQVPTSSLMTLSLGLCKLSYSSPAEFPKSLIN
jgi:hypothetical protein